eukprot:g5179.t1
MWLVADFGDSDMSYPECDVIFVGERDSDKCSKNSDEMCSCGNANCKIGQTCIYRYSKNRMECVSAKVLPTSAMCKRDTGPSIDYRLTHMISIGGISATAFNSNEEMKSAFQEAVATTLGISKKKIPIESIVAKTPSGSSAGNTGSGGSGPPLTGNETTCQESAIKESSEQMLECELACGDDDILQSSDCKCECLTRGYSALSQICPADSDVMNAKDKDELERFISTVQSKISCENCGPRFEANLIYSMVAKNVVGIDPSSIESIDTSAKAEDSTVYEKPSAPQRASSPKAKEDKGMTGGAIAAAVLVPLFAVAALIGALAYYKHRRVGSSGALQTTGANDMELVKNKSRESHTNVLNPLPVEKEVAVAMKDPQS